MTRGRNTNAQRRRADRQAWKLMRRGSAGWASSAAAERAQQAGARDPKAAMQALDAALDRAGMQRIAR